MRDRLIVLRSLECLRQIRVEVVLSGKTAVLRDFTVQCQANLDGVFNSLVVDDRQGTWQSEGHWRNKGVRVATERVGRSVKHLGLRAQLDVNLDTENRVELFDRVFIIHEVFHHSLTFQSAAGHLPATSSLSSSTSAATSYIF